jgi:rubredoxin
MEEETCTSNDPLADMLADIIGSGTHFNDVETEPTAYAKEFYKMISTAEEVVHDHTQVSRLAAVTRLMGIKSQHNLPADCVNSILGLLGDMLPKGHKMPASFYECKNMLRALKMPYMKIDVCTNNCMLYYKQDENKDKCDICGESRYEAIAEENSGIKYTRIPRKVMRYLPITARLQRMYLSAELAKHMRWHKEGERSYS